MEQHAVPQNIASYQFRLVGDMTLKQFLELAAGGVLALIVYKSGLPEIIKWPFIVVFALAGVTFAFFPFEERPLDIWIVNFFKSIYRPTFYLWKKVPKLPDFFFFAPAKEKAAAIKRLTPEERLRFAEYLKSLPKESHASLFDQKEAAEMGKINQYLKLQTGLNPQDILISPPAGGLTILPSVKIRKLQKKEELKTATPMIKMAEAFAPSVEIGTPFKLPKPKPKPPKKEKPKKTPKPVIKPQLPLISRPEFANTIVGMVLTPEEKILPGAIIEIRDATGMPVRASKTNKLGQFFIATPLANGEYEMETEYPDFTFDIIKFKAEGKILPPVKIKAKEVKF